MTREDCLALDAADRWRRCASSSTLPPGVIYLDGNSLGVLPRAAGRVAQVVRDEWGRDLIQSWNTAGWITLPQRVGDKIAKLVGAGAGRARRRRLDLGEPCTRCSSPPRTSCAPMPRPPHRDGASAATSPTDLYIAEGLARELGWTLELIDDPASIANRLRAGDVAILMLTHVNYRSGRMHDMTALTDARTRRHAGGLGPRAQRRRGAGRPSTPPAPTSRSAAAIVPQRRPRCAGLRSSSRDTPSASGSRCRLDGTRGAVRVHARLPARAGHRALPVRHAAGALAGGARVRRRHLARDRRRSAAWRRCARSRWR